MCVQIDHMIFWLWGVGNDNSTVNRLTTLITNCKQIIQIRIGLNILYFKSEKKTKSHIFFVVVFALCFSSVLYLTVH